LPCVKATPTLSDEATWHNSNGVTLIDIPPSWRSWLFDRGSLTQHLTTASKGAFRVQILQQEVMHPRLSEQGLLDMPNRSLALVREVFLYGNNQPWVFARICPKRIAVK